MNENKKWLYFFQTPRRKRNGTRIRSTKNEYEKE